MWSWFEQWNTRRKLRRGRCTNCDTILRDDVTDGFCSDTCADDYLARTAY